MIHSIPHRSAIILALGVIGVLVLGVAPPPAHGVSTGVVISQIYGGGGNTGAPWHNDYIELFNLGGVTVDLTGWTVQYASSAGTTWATTALSGSIPPGGYYLVQQAPGAGGGAALPTPDATGTTAMSLSSGKVALVSNATALSGACPAGGAIVDLVGYGTGASCSETAPAPTLSNTSAALRISSGCTDTDDNASDFEELAPAPRNSASPTHGCEHTLTVTVDPLAGGTVTRSPDQATYPHNDSVDLTPVPAYGYHFVRWSGDASGAAVPLTVLMDDDKTVTAHFRVNDYVGIVRISQIYGGGGNTGAPWLNDFVELFNGGDAPIDVTGWSLQYASSGGTTWFSTTLVGTIPAGGYYLIEEDTEGGSGAPLPTPDGIGTIAIDAIAGKVALVDNNVTLTGSCPSGGGIVDLVGYGGADCSETAPAEALDNVTGGFRNNAGCDDTDDNASDFSTATPAPRNSSTPASICTEWVAVSPFTDELGLGAPVPNPTRGALRIAFTLARDAQVRLRVHDLQGRVVATLADGAFSAGRHPAVWSGMTAAGPARSGVYFVRLQASGRAIVRRVTLTR